MIRYQQQVCPRCGGTGQVDHRHQMVSCPLCGGRKTINDFDHPLDEDDQRAPPAVSSAELLAHVFPRCGVAGGPLPRRRRSPWTPNPVTTVIWGEPYRPDIGGAAARKTR